mmetsp:Transcript_25435/g.22444  ORF Transcript_25435/g.22444 Transcript_25435/m.22444 type:complete len:116 (+) Transcript_25435:142-489(+)
MDDNLNVYFIEANAGPGLNPNNDEKDRVFRNMLFGMYDIEFALLRSRIKRVVNFVNRVDADAKRSGKELSVYLKENEKDLKAEFANVTMNRFEPEYNISLGNTWEYVLDENYLDI